MAQFAAHVLLPPEIALSLFPLEPCGLLIVFADCNPEDLKHEDAFSNQHGCRPSVRDCSIRPVAQRDDHLADHPANLGTDNPFDGDAEVT
jgi:hypothetical protein